MCREEMLVMVKLIAEMTQLAMLQFIIEQQTLEVDFLGQRRVYRICEERIEIPAHTDN